MSKKRFFSGRLATNGEECKLCEKKDECIVFNRVLTAYSILVNCEGFYFVFCELEKIDVVPKLNGNIEQVKASLEQYEKSHQNIPCLMSPLVTNGALALELAFKFLIFNDNGKFECVHDLAVLFSQLPQVHSEELKNKIFKELHQDEVTFNENMNRISNCFADFRYSFEKSGIGYSNFFNGIVHTVCDYTISLKKDLGEFIDSESFSEE